jgi:hypothetical protein
MTPVEDQLRTAFAERASQITEEAPPLRLDRGARGLRRAVRRGGGAARFPGWLTPVAAAIAVLAIAAISVVMSGRTASPAPTNPPVGAVPPYYVAIVNRSAAPARDEVRMIALLRTTATGAVLARITAPRPYVSFEGVTGAADDRTFVLSASEAGKGITAGRLPAERLFLLRLNPRAHSAAARASLTALRLRLPANSQITAMALAPDGQSLAVVTMAAVGMATELRIYAIGTGSTRVWHSPRCGMLCIGDGLLGPAATQAISWTADGRTLALEYNRGLRLLNVRAQTSNLLTASRLVQLHGAPLGWPGESVLDGQWRVVSVAPDGKSVFIGVQFHAYREDLLRFSTKTGALISVLNHLSVGPRRTWEQLLWSSRDGSTVVLTGIRLGATAGIVRGRGYTPIPWSALIQDAAW